MNSLFKRKKDYIVLLQKYNGWGQNKEEVDDLLSGVDVADTDFQNATYIFQTKILINTNKIVSPINLDITIELPIVELFIDKDNFVVFTTKRLYNCRNSSMCEVEYMDILGVDEVKLNDVLCNRRTKLKIEQFIDINLILLDGSKVLITVEYSIAFRPIIYFLAVVNKQKSEI